MLRPLNVFQILTLLAGFATSFANAQALGCSAQILDLARRQLDQSLPYIGTLQFPQFTIPPAHRWQTVGARDWASGFFPGYIWLTYERQLDSSLLARARAQTSSLASEAKDGSGHDIGFRIMTSFGNGYRVTRNPAYLKVILEAAQTMSTLYRPQAGVIDSWPSYDRPNTSVIIDGMMTLELLFYAAQNGGSSTWYDMAVSHALQTMRNHVRPDGSTYQGIEYRPDGTVYRAFTGDGYSYQSTWSRGQAWGIYGFTMVYRYTRDPRFLATAERLADYFIAHLPPDFIPYWDFSQKAGAPRDSSAAAIAASGMLELSTFMTDRALRAKYHDEALHMQASLSRPGVYLATPSATDGLLLHGTYSVPAHAGIDTSLIWGDYYFLESCYRAMSRPVPGTKPPKVRTPGK